MLGQDPGNGRQLGQICGLPKVNKSEVPETLRELNGGEGEVCLPPKTVAEALLPQDSNGRQFQKHEVFHLLHLLP